MTVSTYIMNSMEKSSWIRKMFEEGAKLKAKHGEDNVFDFSLGNPDVPPPEKFYKVIKDLAGENTPGIHGYMPNAGYPGVREAIADKVSREHGMEILGSHVIMTCGAAGGLNVVLKTILNFGDQVIVPKPYFVEYGFYIANHGGKMELANTKEDFSLDVDAIKDAITDKTRAVLINSPHNPTGRVYPEQAIIELGNMLSQIHRKSGRVIYLISDEPYREIVYNGIEVPSILKNYTYSIVVTSYSKSLSLPGERIGYVALNPAIPNVDNLMSGCILSNRILGYVNAPAFMQRVVARLTEETVDIEAYQRRKDVLTEGLRKAGYSFADPEGAFYIFCKSPMEDDVAFVKHLLNFNILAVPGSGFGGPGYFRLTYCIPEDVIQRSLPGFNDAIKTVK